jgi:hypothetical protein
MVVELDLSAGGPPDGPRLEQIGGGQEDPSTLGDVDQLRDLSGRNGKPLGDGQQVDLTPRTRCRG